MGICLILGRSKCLPRWFGALMQWKLKFKWVFACVKEGVKACQDALGHLSPSKRWFDKVAQIGPKIKCPRVPGWVRGGVQSQFGQCPNRSGNISVGASLICMIQPVKDPLRGTQTRSLCRELPHIMIKVLNWALSQVSNRLPGEISRKVWWEWAG